MGIFSTIGGFIGGPFGTAIGNIGDAIFAGSEERKQVKRQNAFEMQKYANLRKAAELGGFHPLAVLNAGGGFNMQAAPRLLTALSASNAFDALEDEISGKAAKDRERQDVRDEIERLERDRLKYEIAASTRTRPTIGTYGKRNVPTDQGPKAMSEIAAPTPINEWGDIDVNVNDGGTGATLRPQEDIVTSTGETISTTVGSDLDEMLTGAAFNVASQLRSGGPIGPIRANAPRIQAVTDFIRGGEDEKMNRISYDYYTRDINEKPPIQWDDRFGPAWRKPKPWDQWDNEQKMRWIYSYNRSKK